MSWVLVAAAVVTAIFIALALMNRSSLRQEAERAEGYRKAASLRGWQFEATAEHVRTMNEEG